MGRQREWKPCPAEAYEYDAWATQSSPYVGKVVEQNLPSLLGSAALLFQTKLWPPTSLVILSLESELPDCATSI